MAPARAAVHLRGIVLIFALAIRTLGLAFAGPVSMIFGSMASDEVRWKEAMIFSIMPDRRFASCCSRCCFGLPIP